MVESLRTVTVLSLARGGWRYATHLKYRVPSFLIHHTKDSQSLDRHSSIFTGTQVDVGKTSSSQRILRAFYIAHVE